jgi:hypothetical protein
VVGGGGNHLSNSCLRECVRECRYRLGRVPRLELASARGRIVCGPWCSQGGHFSKARKEDRTGRTGSSRACRCPGRRGRRALRDRDVIVGCADTLFARSDLQELVSRYLIPYVDIGAGEVLFTPISRQQTRAA